MRIARSLFLRSARLKDAIAISNLVEVKIINDITDEYLSFLVLRHTGKHLFNHAAGIGPIARGVRKVATPPDPVDTDVVAQPQAYRVINKPPEAMLPNIFTWLFL